MRIVHIEDFFHPDAGYQINLLAKYQAARNNEVYILTSTFNRVPKKLKQFFNSNNLKERDLEYTARTGVKIIRLPVIAHYSRRAIYTPGLFRLPGILKPDILYIHGNDSFAGIIITLFHRFFKFPLIMDNHMLEMATNNKFNKIFRWWYRNFMAPVVNRNKITVIKVHDDDYLNKYLGIKNTNSPYISFGTDTLLFYPDNSKRIIIREKNKIYESDFVILYMGKITEDKGVDILVRACKEKFNTEKKVILALAGNISSSYGKIVEDLLLKSENKILRFPTQKYCDLPDFYRMADLVVFPKHCSLSFFDAQACGVPVILELNEVNVKRIFYGNGLIFKSGDVEDLRKKIEYVLNLDSQTYNKMKNSALNYIISKGFDYKNIERKYQEEIDKAINEYKMRHWHRH